MRILHREIASLKNSLIDMEQKLAKEKEKNGNLKLLFDDNLPKPATAIISVNDKASFLMNQAGKKIKVNTFQPLKQIILLLTDKQLR